MFAGDRTMPIPFKYGQTIRGSFRRQLRTTSSHFFLFSLQVFYEINVSRDKGETIVPALGRNEIEIVSTAFRDRSNQEEDPNMFDAF